MSILAQPLACCSAWTSLRNVSRKLLNFFWASAAFSLPITVNYNQDEAQITYVKRHYSSPFSSAETSSQRRRTVSRFLCSNGNEISHKGVRFCTSRMRSSTSTSVSLLFRAVFAMGTPVGFLESLTGSAAKWRITRICHSQKIFEMSGCAATAQVTIY